MISLSAKNCETFSPYSIQKRPELQICPKFVPAIVFGGSSQGLKNLWIFVKICLKITFFFSIFWLIFHKILTPDWNPPKQSLGQILDKFGVRAAFECCKGKKVSQAKNLESVLLAEPHVAVMFSCRTLTGPAKVSFRTLQIAEPKALTLEKDYFPEPWNAGSFQKCHTKSAWHARLPYVVER